MKFACVPLAALTLLVASHGAWAVMPPYYEARAAMGRIDAAEQQRAQASDVVQLRVEQVQVESEERNRCPSLDRWRVKAQVLGVTRGALTPGVSVQLHYTQERYQCPGPVHEGMPTLQKTQMLDAYLNCQDAVCELAAGGFSFQSEAQFQQGRDARQADLKRWPTP